jgi:hypothetical protein
LAICQGSKSGDCSGLKNRRDRFESDPWHHLLCEFPDQDEKSDWIQESKQDELAEDFNEVDWLACMGTIPRSHDLCEDEENHSENQILANHGEYLGM